MKLLVVGSRGFIGTALFNHFLLMGYEVIGCDQIENTEEKSFGYHCMSVMSDKFTELVSEFKPDYCINAAGSGNVGHSVNYPSADFAMNVQLVERILDTLRNHASTCRFIQISSAAVYGNPQSLPIHENFPYVPISPYGYHKCMSELLCKEYFSVYNFPISIVRPFSVYGNGLRKQLLWDLCNKCSNSDNVTLFGTGKETRDFIHVSDLCRSVELICQNSQFELDVYNLANGKGVSIGEIARSISQYYDGKKISFNQQIKEGDPLHWEADINKIKTIGYTQKMTLNNGIRDYVKWFLSQFND